MCGSQSLQGIIGRHRIMNPLGEVTGRLGPGVNNRLESG